MAGSRAGPSGRGPTHENSVRAVLKNGHSLRGHIGPARATRVWAPAPTLRPPSKDGCSTRCRRRPNARVFVVTGVTEKGGGSRERIIYNPRVMSPPTTRARLRPKAEHQTTYPMLCVDITVESGWCSGPCSVPGRQAAESGPKASPSWSPPRIVGGVGASRSSGG